MTSKISSFDLLKENLKRRVWSWALCSLLFFFLFPIAMLLQASSCLSTENILNSVDPAAARAAAQKEIYENFCNWVMTDNGFLSFILVCLAAVIGVSALSWLHNRSKTDFYHCLPVRREHYFGIVTLGSVLIVALPYFLMSLLASLVVNIYTGYPGCFAAAIAGFCGHMCFFLLAYMTTVLAMLLTGNTFVALLGICVFYAYGPSLTGLITGMMAQFFRTFYGNEQHLMMLFQHSSAFVWMLPISDIPEITRALKALAGAFLLGLFCLWLIRIRRSEAAGNAISFRRTEAPIKFLISVPAGMGCGLIMYAILGSDAWAVFWIICSTFISCCIMEIIYHFDFKALFSHRIQLAACILLALAGFAFFRFDLAGYDRYIPKTGDVSSAALHCDDFGDLWQYRKLRLEQSGNGNYYIQYDDSDQFLEFAGRMHSPDIEAFRTIAEQSVSWMFHNTDAEGNPVADPQEDSGYNYGRILLCWHLKNGRDVVRSYGVDKRLIHGELDRIHDSLDYKTAFYPVFSMDQNQLDGVDLEDYSGIHSISFNDANASRDLLSIYLEELGGLTAETRRHENPVCCLQFKTEEFRQMSYLYGLQEEYDGPFSHTGYYPVYPSFKNTLAFLAENGIRPGLELSADAFDSIMINDLFYTEDSPEERKNSGGVLIVQDRGQIQEILDASCISGMNCSNALSRKMNGLSVVARKNENREQTESTEESEPFREDSYYGLELETEKLPGFVKEYFGIEEEDLVKYSSPSY